MSTKKKQSNKSFSEEKTQLNGVVIGVLVGITDLGDPLVIYPSNPEEAAIKAKATTTLTNNDIGKEVALLFEGGNPIRPLIIGLIQNPQEVLAPQKHKNDELLNAEIDGEHITLSAKQSMTLKCGKASVTLTKAGKILVRGTYILNRSSGVNRIKGGSVQIN